MELEVQRRLLDAAEELKRAAQIAGDSAALDRLELLRGAILSGDLQIAVVGELGNGKSTLINSLIALPLLPTGMAAGARALTVVSHGPKDRAFLVYTDGIRLEIAPELLRELGPEQIERLDRVEVETPVDLLETASLIDAPGLGDPEEGSAGGRDRVIESAECAFCVLNCDWLLSMTERSFIVDRLLTSGAARVAFVLNRADGKSPEEIESLKDRARHLLGEHAPDPVVLAYSALHVLQGKLQQDEDRLRAADPDGLLEFLQREWIEQQPSLRAESAGKKLNQIAASLEASILQQDSSAGEAVEKLRAEVQEAEAGTSQLEEQLEAACRRAIGGLEGVREQFLVGLKDYALKLREAVPDEILEVPVDEARRFLPFYIQEALKRAVDENHDMLQAAVVQVLDCMSSDAGEAIRSQMTAFHIDVEPPAIPLYVGRERAPLSQGSFFIMAAGMTLALTQAYLGALLVLGSFLSREIGKQLEAADRRASLGASAQTLVHGSIESMEHSVNEQFKELEEGVRAVILETLTPHLEQRRSDLQESKSRLEEAERAQEQSAARIKECQERLQAARQHLGAGN